MDRFRKRTRWQGVKKKSFLYRLVKPTKLRRIGVSNVLDMLASSAIIGVTVKLAGYSKMTDSEAIELAIASVCLVICSYLIKME